MSIPLDAVTTIFIFLIGLPALLLQSLAPELRKIIRQYRWQLISFTILPLFLAGILVAAGIELSHLGEQEKSQPDFSASLLSKIVKYDGQLLWIFILTSLVLISGILAVVLSEQWRRDAIIRKLRKRAAKGIARDGRPIEEELKGLIQLGRHSDLGRNKDLVLQALAELASATQTCKRYDGQQLEVLIKGLQDVLILGPLHLGSLENFHTTADLLAEIVIPAARARHSEDLKLAVQAISVLARTCLNFSNSFLPMKYLEALELLHAGEHTAATWMSQALFEIGSEAIANEQTLVAMAALSKLDGLAQRRPRLAGELAHDYLSLAAHFWKHGETGQRYAMRMLEGIAPAFTLDLPEALQAAQAHCAQTAKFATSDYLLEMLQGLREAEPAG